MHRVRVLGLALLCGALFPLSLAEGQVINEIRVDQPSTDDDEYFELFGTPGQSLAGLTYITIGDGAGGSGVVEAVVDLTGVSLDGNGRLVVAESTFTLGIADLTADLAFENSDNVTHLLVSGFSGAGGDDLDTDDDGTLDVMPWTSVLDCIALLEESAVPPVNTEFTYCADTVGPDGAFVPGHVYRSPDGTGAFAIGAFDPVGGNDTPGTANNLPEDCGNGVDDDGDGDVDCADADCAGEPACVTPPANDLCASATPVGEGVFPFTTLGASTDGPNNCGGSLENDVWFLFQSPCTGLVTLTTCGTASVDFNPQMAVYDAAGGCPTMDNWIACDAGSCTGSGEPEILFSAVMGESYYVQIGGFSGDRGDATLTIECASPDCHVAPNPNLTETFTAESAFTSAPAAPIEFVPLFDSIIVTGIGTISDVDVQVNVTHPFIGDLTIEMVAPSTTQVTLHSLGTGGGQFDMDVRFDDEGAPNDTVPFFAGLRMQPSSPLSVLDGQNADGGWAITVLDDFLTAPGDPARGTLDQWSLIFPMPATIPDNDPAGLDLTLPVSNLEGINDLDVAVDILHPATSDLTVALSRDGTSVTLHNMTPGVDIVERFDDPVGGTNDGFGTRTVDGPGLLADFDGSNIGGDWTLSIVDDVPGNVGTFQSYDLLFCPSDCLGISDLDGVSSCADDTVTLSWTNNDTYSGHEILRDGVSIGTAPGGDSSYVDTLPLPGFHEYTVVSQCSSGGFSSFDRDVNHFGYNGEAHIVLQLEGLVDFGDPGANDSGAAIETALLAAGIGSVVRISIAPEDFPCLTSPGVQSIWVAAGTYPFNYTLTSAQADILGNANAAGIALYLESADHWGFFHDASTLDGRDGVDDSIHCDTACEMDPTNGDDTFLGMDGANSGFGLDLSALQNIAYMKDNTTTALGGSDSNDQLAAAVADAAGPNAGVIWRLDDALGTPYDTAIFYDTNSGGKTIVQSWELGGFGGDVDALVAEYVNALMLTGPPPGSFDRGDCNADGGMNIADAVFLLGTLFSGGPAGTCADSCDANDDGGLNIADAIFTLGNLFSGGPDPAPPFGACGPDPTADGLDCASFPPCP